MAGSIVECSIQGRSFPVASDSDGSKSLGGRENTLEVNGDGVSGRVIQEMKGWSLSGLNFAIDNDNDDQEFLQNFADAGKFGAIKLIEADGTVYAGKGTITGKIEVSTMNGTAPLTLEGPGKFQKQ